MFETKERSRLGAALLTGLLLVVAVAATAAAQDQDAPAATAAPAATVELSFGTGIDRETRDVTGASARFATADFTEETGQIYCLSRVMNIGAPAAVTHVWYHDGTTMAKVDLNVGSEDWRTWSSKRILRAWTGNWEVKVLDANGMVLASAGFVIE